ncbi:MAG: hypothetical protein MHM6MM_006104 [Cercozoa sp. M6MM]
MDEFSRARRKIAKLREKREQLLPSSGGSSVTYTFDCDEEPTDMQETFSFLLHRREERKRIEALRFLVSLLRICIDARKPNCCREQADSKLPLLHRRERQLCRVLHKLEWQIRGARAYEVVFAVSEAVSSARTLSTSITVDSNDISLLTKSDVSSASDVVSDVASQTAQSDACAEVRVRCAAVAKQLQAEEAKVRETLEKVREEIVHYDVSATHVPVPRCTAKHCRYFAPMAHVSGTLSVTRKKRQFFLRFIPTEDMMYGMLVHESGIVSSSRKGTRLCVQLRAHFRNCYEVCRKVSDDASEQVCDDERESSETSEESSLSVLTHSENQSPRGPKLDKRLSFLFERHDSLLADESDIVSPEMLRKLIALAPERLTTLPWKLTYATWRDGYSLRTLLLRAAHEPGQHSLLIVRSHTGRIFGGVTSSRWRMSQAFYGRGESCVFRIDAVTHHNDKKGAEEGVELSVFRWTGANAYVQFAQESHLAMGGGGHFAIYLDRELQHGSSGKCTTFASPPLAGDEDFIVNALELWTVVRDDDDDVFVA